jgi:hypothetical protein
MLEMGVFIGKVCPTERVARDKAMRCMATYYKQLL